MLPWEELKPILEESQVTLFSWKEGKLKIVHKPSCFFPTLALKEKCQKLVESMNKEDRSEKGSLLDFEFCDFHTQGKVLYGVRKNNSQSLLFLWSFSARLKIDYPRLCQEENLTYKECVVVEKIMEGLTNREVAKSLGNSLHTIKTHVRNAYRKLGISSRSELILRLLSYLTPWPDQRK